MGKFEILKLDNKKSYTLFSKKSFKKILNLDNELPQYEFIPICKKKVQEIFYDSENNLLKSAGIILSKVIDINKAYFKIEREDYLIGKKLVNEKKVYIHSIGINDTILDHSMFLIEGITSMFSTKFNIDFENILKMVFPNLIIENKIEEYKILSGKGFKAQMNFEQVKFNNYSTKIKKTIEMLTIQQLSTDLHDDEFRKFVSELEKDCKEIIPTEESKYKIALRITQKQI